MEKIIKTDDEWRQILTEEQFRVTRKHGTEPAFSGALYDKHDAGTYHCICCGAALFDSQTKFEIGVWLAEFLCANGSCTNRRNRR